MCTDCGKRFANKTRLKNHVDWEHLKNFVHSCGVCQKVFKSHTSLYLHRQVVHKKDNAEHLCDHCGKPFPMALDVHLTRDVNERWGFELVGGADDEIPLTIVKIQESSPASRAGLQSGDTIITINREEAIDFSHEEACRRVAECADSLTVGVMRGLYDPVLDDQEPIFYEPGDLDPESQPTEVPFKVQRFLEPGDLGSSVIDYNDTNEPLGTPFDPSELLNGARSLTASPYMNPNKPYRPFSTEPPEVPSLEEPIILNPDYKDEFGKLNDIDPDYILNAYNKDGGCEGKYKLPISKQYDPDGKRKVNNTEIDSVLLKYLNMENLSKTSLSIDEKITKSNVQDCKVSNNSEKILTNQSNKETKSKSVKEGSSMVTVKDINSKEENYKKDVRISDNRQKISKEREETLISEEFKYIGKMKQEIDVAQIERAALSVVEDSIERASSVAEEIKKEIEVELAAELERSSAEHVKYETKQNTSALKSESKVKQSTELVDHIETDFEVIDKIASNKEHLQYIEDNIREQQIKAEDNNVSKSVFSKDSESHITSHGHESSPTLIIKDVKHSEKTSARTEEYKNVTKTVSNGTKSDKSGAQQRTYELGLQTIPNIRGIAHSSYHYDLLLRTFFLHLTDVMVALSRFLLSQPIFNTEHSETCKTVSESKMYESDVKDVRKTQHESVKIEKQKMNETKMKEIKTQEKMIDRRQLVTPISMEESRIESYDKSDSKVIKKIGSSEVVEKKVISGAQLAQRTEKKVTQDVTQKMGAVISEFQTIAVEENKQEMLERSRRSRSRSRSQIEEEVAKESDPLVWLDKVDSRRASQEVSEERLSKKEYSSTETSERKHYEKLEKQEIKYKKAKSPKQMYLAVVESHVYTNKDVIFEDAAEYSETSSVQSADEVNTTFEAMEAMQTENVMLENAVQQIEQAKIVEESQALSRINANVATVQKNEVVVKESKSIKQEERKENVSIAVNETHSKTASSEIHNVSKSEFNSNKESVSIIEQEYRESVRDVKESRQKVEITDTVDVVKAEIKAEPQVQIEDVTEKVLIKTEKPSYKEEDEYAALKIVKEVEIENDAANEIVEIEEVEVNKIEINKELQLDTSVAVTEKSIVSSNETVTMESQSKTTSEINMSTSIENYKSESHTSEKVDQESSFTAKSVNKHLTIRTDLSTQNSIDSPPSTIDTPTPSTVPPTPLTDEYVFQLTIPLPKSRTSTPIPRDCTLSPEDEDPHIVKKKLIPHIETTIEKIVYDPPLPTPPGDKPLSPIFKTPGLFGGSSKPVYKIRFPPIYRKPGLFGGADNPEFNKEEIREIERKSSLLASAIDETIKSIEEYKEEVGIETKKEVKVVHFKEETETHQESYSKETITESLQNGYKESETIENNDVITMNGDSESIVEIAETEVSQNVEIDSQKLTSEIELIPEVNIELKQEVEPKEFIEMPAYKIASNSMQITQGMNMDTETYVEMNNFTESTVEHENQISEEKMVEEEEKKDPMLGFRPVVFDPEAIQKRGTQHYVVQEPSTQEPRGSPYLTESGEIIGTIQGIVDGLEEPVMDPELAKELGKPGISEQKIAELISGEAEMLREAHVMGLSRVLNSHMHRADDSSVDFQKIKPMIDSLKDSEVLKALNEDLARQREEERKKEEKRWTTFLQKPQRAPPKAKFGYHGWTADEQALVEEPYKVKIVKQAKPKVAPDYKPEDFETGPLPWEQRAELESAIPPAEPEEPILVPELPEYLEAVDPLTESEVPDLEDTGIPLPPPREPTPSPVIEQIPEEEEPLIEAESEAEVEEVIEDTQETEEMESRIGEQLVRSVQAMVDPNAPVEQQLSQMRAQLAALAQLPEVIQQTLELVSRQLNKMGQQETHIEMSASKTESHSCHEIEVTENHLSETYIQNSERSEDIQNHEAINGDAEHVTIEEVQDTIEAEDQVGEMVPQCGRVPTPQVTEEDIREEKILKEKDHQRKVEADSRQIKQRAAPRVGKPTRMFGPLDPDSRPVVLPGGRRWRKTEDVYNEQMIAETLQAQSELLQGKTMGINFMKYEKPPVTLDHLQNSETYKLVHDMDQPPLRKVEMLKPVIAEADYRERCRSSTPSGALKHQLPQQFHP